MSNDSPYRKLLSEWFDGEPTVPTATATFELTKRDQTQIADELLTHALLIDLARHDETAESARIRRVIDALEKSPVSPSHKPSARRNITYGIVVTVACLCLVSIALFRPSSADASVALQKIMASVSATVDRTYRLEPILGDSRRDLPSKNDFDGAMLHVGGPNRFVFVHRLVDGRTRCSGCDGNESWTFREDGPVHVSNDLKRFRGRIPGQQHNLGFTDISSQLDSLRNNYDLALSTTRDTRVELLIGEKKSRKVRGPNKIEIEFDRDTGTVLSMLLTGLPRAQGGPDGMRLTLVSEGNVVTDFYSHGSHHAEWRKVRYE